MNEEGYLSLSVHEQRQPKTKAEVFSLLCNFGQFYLQIYPAKTAGFLEYLRYLTENTSDMTDGSGGPQTGHGHKTTIYW